MTTKRSPLTEKQKLAIYQRAAVGMKRKEIASELGLTYQAVTSLLWSGASDTEGAFYKPRQLAAWPEGVNYE